MDPAAFVPLGRIVKSHGLAGEVSVAADLPLERCLDVDVWFVPPSRGVRTARITGVRPGPKGPLVKLAGVDDIDAAGFLRGSTIVTSEASLPRGFLESAQVADDEDDPVGLSIIDAARGPIGTVVEVIVTGANDVWIIEGGPYGQVLIPVIDAVIQSCDFGTMTAQVRLLPGLIEDE